MNAAKCRSKTSATPREEVEDDEEEGREQGKEEGRGGERRLHSAADWKMVGGKANEYPPLIQPAWVRE